MFIDMPMFRGGHRRYIVFMRRCARGGMVSSLLLIGTILCGIALGDAVISVAKIIWNAAAPWSTAARMVGVMTAVWIVVAVVITLLLAWHRYREDQEKFIKVMSEKP